MNPVEVTRRRPLRVAGVLVCTLAFAALLLPGGAAAAGQTYEVVQCDPANRSVSGVALDDAPAYAVTQSCGDARSDHAIKIINTAHAQYTRSGRVRWVTRSPSLAIVGVDAQAKLRRHNGHVPRLWVADAGQHELARVASGGAGATGFRKYSWHSPRVRASQFVASLRCERSTDCPKSDLAKTWLRNVHLEVADYSDPRFDALGGSLLEAGWLRGEQSLRAHWLDAGSGVDQTFLAINGLKLATQRGACNRIPGTNLAGQFSPCGSELLLQGRVMTSNAPFQDGPNAVLICGVDFAGNRSCDRQVAHVDTTPPMVAFASSQLPDDPELIRAPIADPTSGVAGGKILYRPSGPGPWRPLNTQLRSGQLQTRLDSTIDPPGQYEFMARAVDKAGNFIQTSKRADGRPMILTFPLKSGVRLNAHLAGGRSRVTVGYGRRSKVVGRLRDASGMPLPDQDVTITEHFGAGALIERRLRTVHTDSMGRWSERVPAGPSRRITAGYAGTLRYLADDTRAGALRVKTKATLHLSRHLVPEGHKVVFKGGIGHLAARMPSRGKLVELEVKDGKRWQTVQRPFHTGPSGRFRLRYRFKRFYVSNVRYHFRLRVIREADWPYKAPVSSRVRKLVVKAH